MNQYVTDTRVKKGRVALKDVPFSDDSEVKVVVIPKANISKMSFQTVQKLTQPITGNLSDDVVSEREDR
ncbi:hypothetical protein ISS37_07070 [candidate division KSB1 bacterium]|nr:hypothetical protein [candidate division KSB1 bacterium]